MWIIKFFLSEEDAGKVEVIKTVVILYNLGPMVPHPTGILRLSYGGPTHFLLKVHESPFNTVVGYGMTNVNEVPSSLNLSLIQSEL